MLDLKFHVSIFQMYSTFLFNSLILVWWSSHFFYQFPFHLFSYLFMLRVFFIFPSLFSFAFARKSAWYAAGARLDWRFELRIRISWISISSSFPRRAHAAKKPEKAYFRPPLQTAGNTFLFYFVRRGILFNLGFI